MVNLRTLIATRKSISEQKKDGVRICSIEGCERKHEAKGFCEKHYSNIYRKKRYHTDAEYREKIKKRSNKRQKERYATDEEYREKLRKHNRNYFKTPKGKEIRRTELIKQRIKNRELADKKRADAAFLRITKNMDDEETKQFAQKVSEKCGHTWKPEITKLGD